MNSSPSFSPVFFLDGDIKFQGLVRSIGSFLDQLIGRTNSHSEGGGGGGKGQTPEKWQRERKEGLIKTKIFYLKANYSNKADPDRPFHNFVASELGDRQI